MQDEILNSPDLVSYLVHFKSDVIIFLAGNDIDFMKRIVKCYRIGKFIERVYSGPDHEEPLSRQADYIK